MKKKVIIATILVVITIGIFVLFQKNNELKDISACVLRIENANEDKHDLQLLEKSLEGKEIIAMGENARGAKEYIEVKSELVKYLIEEKEFRAFVIDDSFGAGALINEYIVNGNGEIDEVVRSLQNPALKTKEMKELLLWMNEFNEGKDNSHKVRFYGCDMQYSPLNEYTYSVMKNFIDDIYTDNNEELYKLIEDPAMISKSGKSKEELSDSEIVGLYNDGIDNITSILEDLDKNKSSYLKKLSAVEYEWAFRYLTILKQNLSNEINIVSTPHSNLITAGAAYRERCMVENVEWILGYENNFANYKAILWADNMDISRTHMENNNIGAKLNEKLGDKYYALGFDFGEGNVFKYDKSSDEIILTEVTKGPKKLFGKYFENIEGNKFLIDINQNKDNLEFENVFNGETVLRYESLDGTVGTVMPVTLSYGFDGIIFIKNISPATLLKE